MPRFQSVLSRLLAVTFLLYASCNNRTEEPAWPSVPVTIQTLECNDHALAKMLSRCVMEFLQEQSNSSVTLSEAAQSGVVITGVVMKKEVNIKGGESRGFLGIGPSFGSGAAVSNSNDFSGSIVEGISLIATVDGKEIASSTYFQTPRKGEVDSPQHVVREATDRLLQKLHRLKLVSER